MPRKKNQFDNIPDYLKDIVDSIPKVSLTKPKPRIYNGRYDKTVDSI
jgi:hypothetical protein